MLQAAGLLDQARADARAHLPPDGLDLRDAGRAKRVAAAQQPSAGVDARAGARTGVSCPALTWTGEPEVLQVNGLCDRERIVHLSDGDLLWRYPCVTDRLPGRGDVLRKARQVRGIGRHSTRVPESQN